MDGVCGLDEVADEAVLLELSPPSGDALALREVINDRVLRLEGERSEQGVIRVDRLSRVELTRLIAGNFILCIRMKLQ